MLILTNWDLVQNQLVRARVENLASAPGSPVTGQIYYDTTLNQFGCYNGSSWDYLGNTPANVVTMASAAAATGQLILSAGASRAVQVYNGGNGLLKATGANDTLAIAVVGTDYVTASSTNTFTNKTFDANGTGNSISNLEVADFATNVVDTDVALTANSDSRIATQRAVKAYVDGIVTGGLEYKGSIDASTNPNYPAATKGDYYKISVAGLIGGGSGVVVQAGDSILANADSVGGNQIAVGASWDVIQGNLEYATTTSIGYVELATTAETEAKSSTTLVVTPSSLASFTRKLSDDIGDGSSTSIVVTHNFGTQNVIVSIVDNSTYNAVITDWQATTINTVTFTFAVAPASSAYTVTIIG